MMHDIGATRHSESILGLEHNEGVIVAPINLHFYTEIIFVIVSVSNHFAMFTILVMVKMRKRIY